MRYCSFLSIHSTLTVTHVRERVRVLRQALEREKGPWRVALQGIHATDRVPGEQVRISATIGFVVIVFVCFFFLSFASADLQIVLILIVDTIGSIYNITTRTTI